MPDKNEPRQAVMLTYAQVETLRGLCKEARSKARIRRTIDGTNDQTDKVADLEQLCSELDGTLTWWNAGR